MGITVNCTAALPILSEYHSPFFGKGPTKLSLLHFLYVGAFIKTRINHVLRLS